MTEEMHRRWDIVSKLIAPVVTVLGLLFGLAQFNREQNNIRERELLMLSRNDAIEFKRRVWERRMNVYMQTARVVGQITVNTGQPKPFKAAVNQFENLYWGTMLLLEDKTTQSEMIRFRVELHDYQEGISSADRLKTRAAYLGQALQKSAHASWVQLSVPGVEETSK